MRGLKEIILSGDIDSELHVAITRAINLIMLNDFTVMGETDLGSLIVNLQAEIKKTLEIGADSSIPELRFKSDILDDDVSIILDKNEKTIKIRVGANTNPTFAIWHEGNFNPDSKANENHIHSDIYYKQQFIDKPQLNQSEKLPILTKPDGKISNKFLEISNLIPQGNFTPSNMKEYPDSPNLNDYWVVGGLGSAGYFFRTSDLGGQRVFNNDEMIYGANGWLVKTNSVNHSHDNFYFRKEEFKDSSEGMQDAGKPIILNNRGVIDVSMLESSTFVPIAPHDPSDVDEYPDTTNYNFGSFWWVENFSNPTDTVPEPHYIFTSGDLQGKLIRIGDFMVWGNAGWGIMAGEMNPQLYYKLDGSQHITANFMGGGFQYKHLADGTEDTDATNVKQLNDGLSTKSDTTHNHDTEYPQFGHHHTISEVDNLQSTLDNKGDMFKANYDTTNSGVVDNAEALNGIPSELTMNAKGVATDCNTLDGFGIWVGVNVANAPELGAIGLEQLQISLPTPLNIQSTDAKAQRCYISSGRWYDRYFVNNVWTEWSEWTNTGDLLTQTSDKNRSAYIIPDNEDLNTITYGRFYVINDTHLNLPSGATNGIMLVSTNENMNYCTQTLISYDGFTFTRGRYNGSWNSWIDLRKEIEYSDLKNIPTEFTPTSHTHAISEVTDLQDALDNKSDDGHTHFISDVANLQDALDNKSDDGHGHAISDVTDLQDALDGKSDTTHEHNSSYYQKSEFLSISAGANDGGKPIVLSASGKIDSSMLDALSFYPAGDFDPSADVEYPDTTSESAGATYNIHELTNPDDPSATPLTYTFTSGDLQGRSVEIGYYMVWSGSHWLLLTNNINPDLYYRLDGANPISADFQAGGNKLVGIADGTEDNHAASVGQLNSGLGGKADTNHTHVVTDVTDLQDALDDKANLSHSHGISDVTDLQTALDNKSDVGHIHDYDTLGNIPSTFPPETHSHIVSDVTDLQTALDNKSDTGHGHTKSEISDFAHEHVVSEITDFPSTMPPSSHAHAISDTTDLQSSLDGKLSTSSEAYTQGILYKGDLGDAVDLNDYETAGLYHQNASDSAANGSNYPVPLAGMLSVWKDGSMTYQKYWEYTTESIHIRSKYQDAWRSWQVIATREWTNTQLSTKSDTGHNHDGTYAPLDHTHGIADVTDLQSALDGKSDDGHTHTKSEITDFTHTHTKSEITDFTHTHGIADVTDLQSALDGKASSSHSHSIGDVTDLQSSLDGKANSSHTHAKADITDFAHTHDAADLSGVPHGSWTFDGTTLNITI